MEFKGAIFDFDGTLYDSMSLWDTIGDDYLIAKDCTPEAGLKIKTKALSLLAAAAYFKETYGLKESEEVIVSEITTMAEYKYCNETEFKHGAIAFVKDLHDKGVKMCIATASDKRLVDLALRKANALQYFCGVITCTDVGCSKENPLIYEKSLEMMETKKEDTVVFEDALHAIETAKKAGFRVIAVYDPSFHNEWEEIKSNSDLHINAYTDQLISDL